MPARLHAAATAQNCVFLAVDATEGVSDPAAGCCGRGWHHQCHWPIITTNLTPCSAGSILQPTIYRRATTALSWLAATTGAAPSAGAWGVRAFAQGRLAAPLLGCFSMEGCVNCCWALSV